MMDEKKFNLQTMTIEKNSVIPIYYQLAVLLKEQIRRGNVLPGQALPTETEIAAHFNISRMTVRQAISELVSAGMVYAQKGKGTFVAKPRLDNTIFDLKNFDEEIKNKGLKLHHKLLEAKIVRADNSLAKRLEIPLYTSCLFSRVITVVDGEPLAFENKYTIYAKQKPILESELKDPSLSKLAATHSNGTPSSSKKVFMVSKTTEEESAILGVNLNTPVFLISQTIYDSSNSPIAWGKSIYRGDRYKITTYDGWINQTKFE